MATRERREPRGGGGRGHSELGERLIAGVPARIMRPRLVFLATLGAILAFGLLMVYSASAVEALSDDLPSTFYLVRQARAILFGLVIMFGISRLTLEHLRSDIVWVIWIGLVVTLFLVLIVGEEHGGATRWIKIAGQQVQPSEFGKSVIIVTAAKIFQEYYDQRSISAGTFLIMMVACVGVPLLAIILEPDMGTCLIIGGTVFAMAFLAGFSLRLVIPLGLVALAVAALFIMGSDYRSARVMSDPWDDPYGDGYQAVLAIMAFASGGLTGRGVGNSTMKYNYLPEAHNDYILAIIGEELGFVGMLAFFALYALMVYAAFKIAAQAPTAQGRLIAYGSAVVIMLQFLVNALGILGVTPMTGKTMPFISYGGSSMIASLMVAGLIWCVSRSSDSETASTIRRSSMGAVEGGPGTAVATIEGSTAGEPHRRSERRSGGDGAHPGWGEGAQVLRGGADDGQPGSGRARGSRGTPSGGRTPRAGGAGGRGRTTLGDSPADRLRSTGPRVRGTRDGRRDRPGGRNRYDR